MWSYAQRISLQPDRVLLLCFKNINETHSLVQKHQAKLIERLNLFVIDFLSVKLWMQTGEL